MSTRAPSRTAEPRTVHRGRCAAGRSQESTHRRGLRPVSLRISVTDQCQLRCLYCTPGRAAAQTRRDVLTFEEIDRFVGVIDSSFRLTKVRITGGEPLIRAGIVDLVAMLARRGVPDLALTTNGQVLAEMAPRLERAGLRRINVSLDSLDTGTYAALTRGGDLRATLEGIDAALGCGLAPVKLNAVVLRGYNDAEVVELARFALDRGCPIRFLEMMPIRGARSIFEDLFVTTSEIRARLEKQFALEPLDRGAGQTSRDFLASDRYGRRGAVGFISPMSRPFCDECTRVRLTSTGRLVSCLMQGPGTDIAGLLRGERPATQRLLGEMVAAELENKHSRRKVREIVS
ncbi:MAG: GTP 3',8-cyclase MoaA, partial [Planctomycetota bacterium]